MNVKIIVGDGEQPLDLDMNQLAGPISSGSAGSQGEGVARETFLTKIFAVNQTQWCVESSASGCTSGPRHRRGRCWVDCSGGRTGSPRAVKAGQRDCQQCEDETHCYQCSPSSSEFSFVVSHDFP